MTNEQKPAAWMHPDGRVVPASTMAAAQRDGGAMKSSLLGYSVRLYDQAAIDAAVAAERERWTGLAQQALTALEGFDRFRRMMEDGPDTSDKLLAEDYAEMAFVQGAQLIPLLRSAVTVAPEPPIPAT